MVIIKPPTLRLMMTQRIERVDTIPLINAMLVNMGVEEVIDSIFKPHGNWGGLSYGKLSVLFVTYCSTFFDPSVVEYGIMGKKNTKP